MKEDRNPYEHFEEPFSPTKDKGEDRPPVRQSGNPSPASPGESGDLPPQQGYRAPVSQREDQPPQPPQGYRPPQPQSYQPPQPQGYQPPQQPQGYPPQQPQGYPPRPPQGYPSRPPQGYRPPMPYNGYVPQPQGGGAAKAFSIVSFVAGCISLLILFSLMLQPGSSASGVLFVYGFLFSVPGLLFGIIALKKRTNKFPLALLGVIFNGLLLFVFFIAVMIVLFTVRY